MLMRWHWLDSLVVPRVGLAMPERPSKWWKGWDFQSQACPDILRTAGDWVQAHGQWFYQSCLCNKTLAKSLTWRLRELPGGWTLMMQSGWCSPDSTGTQASALRTLPNLVYLQISSGCSVGSFTMKWQAHVECFLNSVCPLLSNLKGFHGNPRMSSHIGQAEVWVAPGPCSRHLNWRKSCGTEPSNAWSWMPIPGS